MSTLGNCLRFLARTLLASGILCSWAPPAAAIVAADYLPLTDGSSWTVRKNGAGIYVRSVTGTVVFNGNSTKAVSFSEDGEIDYYTNDGNGIRLHGGYVPSFFVNGCGYVASTLTFVPPAISANANMSLGETVNSSGSLNVVYAGCASASLTYTHQSTIVGFEMVTIPAGTFNALKVIRNLNAFYQGSLNSSQTVTSWVVQAVGSVKSISTDSSGTNTYELTNTNVSRTFPDAYSFSSQTNLTPNSQATSNAVTITGVTAAAAISVAGGMYSINGGTFTATPGTVTNGQTVAVRLTAPSAYATSGTATLTVGSVSGAFTVTTLPPPALVSLLIEGVTSLPEGSIFSYAARATYSDSSNQLVTANSWSILSGPATISAAGVFTAGAVSASTQATIFASYTTGGVTRTANLVVTITDSPPTLSKLAIIGPNAMATGTARSLTVLAQYTNGAVQLVVPSWSISGSAAGLSGASLQANAVATYDTVTVTASYTDSGVTRSAAKIVTVYNSSGPLAWTPDVGLGFNLASNPFGAALNVAAVYGNIIDSMVSGVSDKIDAVWRWNASTQKWQFYTPQLTAAQSAAYATSHNYEVLASVPAGESYWINSYVATSLPAQTGTPMNYGLISFGTRPPLWNLLATGTTLTPPQFNANVGLPPSPGQPAAPNFESLWMWHAALGKWFFYSPQLDSGVPFTNCQYAANNGLLCFDTSGKQLEPGDGFWVYKP